MWEHAIAVRLKNTLDQFDDLGQDMAGIAKILSSHSLTTKPLDWAFRFAGDPRLGARFGVMVARSDANNPPPAVWHVSPSILDEVARCLLDDLAERTQVSGITDLVVGRNNGSLVIDCSARRAESLGKGLRPGHRHTPDRGRVRTKLLELTWSRYNGVVQHYDKAERTGFRLILDKPKVKRPAGWAMHERDVPPKRIRESHLTRLSWVTNRLPKLIAANDGFG